MQNRGNIGQRFSGKVAHGSIEDIGLMPMGQYGFCLPRILPFEGTVIIHNNVRINHLHDPGDHVRIDPYIIMIPDYPGVFPPAREITS